MLKFLILLSLFLCASIHTAADIAFLSDRDGKTNIYVMNDDGSNVRRLTDTPMTVGSPNWSPDGQQIAFIMDLNSAEPGNPQGLQQQFDIFVINADGTRQMNLTQHPAQDFLGSWSPNGKYLVFDSGRAGHAGDVSLEIHVMEVATHKVWQLTNFEFASDPKWSPDGTQIVYESVKRGEGRHIHIMDADGTNPRPLLRQPRKGFGGRVVGSYFPSWSPDGQYILYNEIAPVTNGRFAASILIVNKDTRHVKGLDTPKNWKIHKVCWADGGSAVLFAAAPNGMVNKSKVFKIYKYRLSDGKITNLTDHPSDNWSMDWTPHNSLSVSAAAKLSTLWAQIKKGTE